MSTVTLVGVGTRAVNTNGNVTPGLPTGLLDGDLLIAWAAANSGAITFTPPAGWNTAVTLVDSSGPTLSIFWKSYVTGDADPLLTKVGSTAGSSLLAKVAAYRNADTINGPTVGVTYSSGATTGTTTGSIPGVAVTGDGLALLFAAWADDYSTQPTLPTGWTLLVNDTVGTTAGASYHASYQSVVSATSPATTVAGHPAAAATRIGVQLAINEGVGPAQTVTPGVVGAAASSSAPTVTPGALAVAPGVAGAAPSVASPSVVPGALSVTPGIVGAVASSSAPTVSPGAITASPPVIGTAAAPLAPTVGTGAPTVVPGVVGTAATPLAPTVTRGAITAAPGVVGAAPSVASPTVKGTLTVSPPLLTAAGSAYDPTVIGGPITISPDVAGAPAQAFTPRIRGDEIVFVIESGGVLDPRVPKKWNGTAWVPAPTKVLR